MVIRIAIVEDDRADAAQLISCLEGWQEAHREEGLEWTVYTDAVLFLEQAAARADVVFMDIEMPHLNGMDAAAEFRKYNREASLIFATRVTRYALRGYAVDAMAYLVKPIRPETFTPVFEKALRLLRQRPRGETVVLKTKDGLVTLGVDRIRSIEASSHALRIDADGQIYQVWGAMDKMEEQLPGQFARCHRGYLVNLNYVDSVTRDCVILAGTPEQSIPLSRQRRGEFMEKLTQYYTQTMGE